MPKLSYEGKSSRRAGRPKSRQAVFSAAPRQRWPTYALPRADLRLTLSRSVVFNPFFLYTPIPTPFDCLVISIPRSRDPESYGQQANKIKSQELQALRDELNAKLADQVAATIEADERSQSLEKQLAEAKSKAQAAERAAESAEEHSQALGKKLEEADKEAQKVCAHNDGTMGFMEP